MYPEPLFNGRTHAQMSGDLPRSRTMPRSESHNRRRWRGPAKRRREWVAGVGGDGPAAGGMTPFLPSLMAAGALALVDSFFGFSPWAYFVPRGDGQCGAKN